MPYYVERVVKPTGYGYKTEWYVMRTGEGAKCRTKDVGFAYDLVDLLNNDAVKLFNNQSEDTA